MKRVLVLFAHPRTDRSEVNVVLAAAAGRIEGVTLVDLYAEYPTFEIDVEKEQARLLDHDVIVFQHPVYWYSCPALLKEWQDLVLESAGAADATVFVAALDDREKQNELVGHVARNYPDCRIIARALDRHHVYELEAAGAHHVEREVFESALSAGRRALIELGAHPFKAERQARSFRTHDTRALDALRENWHDGGMDSSYVAAARSRTDELERIMQSDRAAERHDSSERGWVPPPRGDAKP